MRGAILVVGALLGAPAAAQAQQIQGGAVTCPNGFVAQRLDGQRVIVCPSPVTREQVERFNREQLDRFNAQEQQRRDEYVRSGACTPGRVPYPPSCPPPPGWKR